MQWTCRPIPHAAPGQPAMPYTTVWRVFAKWADDGSRWQAFLASVRHLALEKHRDLRVRHGDGTNTVAPKGKTGWATRATHTRRRRKSAPSRTILVWGGSPPSRSRA